MSDDTAESDFPIIDPLEAARAIGLRYVSDAEPGLRREPAADGGFTYLDARDQPVGPRVVARIAALRIPPAWVEVWICPRADGHLQATGRDARERKQYRYHPDWSATRNQTKYHRLAQFGAALPGLRQRMDADLARRGLPRDKVLAAVLSLMELTYIRVGNVEYARANRSYGLTTLRDKHVQVICRANAEEVPEMVRLAHRYRAGALNYKLAGLREGTEAARIREDQRAWLLAEGVPAATALAAELGVETNLDVFAAQLGAGGGDTAPIADVGCFMGHVYARVLVDGTVLYCCNTEVVVGSLSQARFSELWRGARWNEWRARLRAGQYLPSCGQCGKLNQNVKIGRKLAAAYGEETLRRVTGRGA